MSGTRGLFLLPGEYYFIETVESRVDFRIKRRGDCLPPSRKSGRAKVMWLFVNNRPD